MLTLIQAPQDITFSEIPTFVKFVTDLPNSTTNLRCRIEIIDEFDAILDTHECSFHPTTRVAVVDIRSAFYSIPSPLPPDDFIPMFNYENEPYNFCLPDAILKYRIRYFEKYDIPIFTTPPQYSDFFFAMQGKKEASVLLPTSLYGNDVHILHEYPNGYRKDVTEAMPDFAYIYSRVVIGAVHAVAEIFLSDKTVIRVDLCPRFPIQKNLLYCFPCGFEQLKLKNNVVAANLKRGVYVRGYAFSLWGEGDPIIVNGNRGYQDKMIMTKNHKLIAPHEAVYIAYENNVSGIEIALFPIVKTEVTTEKTTTEKELFDQANAREGQFSESVGTITEKITVKSLVMPRNEILMMSKIIEKPIWQFEKGKFTRVFADTKSLEMPPNFRVNGQFVFAFKKFR
jgi:hypothetical protein